LLLSVCAGARKRRQTKPALLLYATAEYWTNFVIQATLLPSTCAVRCDIVICRARTRYDVDAS
jgi:hypothetical protein